MSDTIANVGDSSSTGRSWIEEKMETVMVVAVMVVTVTFAAALNPPGGITPDGVNAVMTLKHNGAYGWFTICNTVSFLLSAATVMLLMCGLPVKNRKWAALIIFIMWGSLSAAVLGYVHVVRAFRPRNSEMVLLLLNYSVFVWMGVTFLVGAYHLRAVIRGCFRDVMGFINFVRAIRGLIAQAFN